jgi:hypothetical protein
MNLQKLSEKLFAQLEEQIRETDSMTNPLEQLKNRLTYVQTALARLKLELGKNGFADQEEEIFFFKKGKPQIYSLLIFITERYAIENSMPLLGKEQQFAHLESQLVFINRFFRQNEFLYQYYRLKATDLDDRYFTRNDHVQVVGFAEVPDVDPSFSTVADYLFSKFMGYERLQDFIKQEIQIRVGAENGIPKNMDKELKWTGDAVNVIELVYGIYETGQINDGKISLTELMDFFGKVFQVNISGYFKRFADIKRRKSMSKTRYLDEMQRQVAKRIEESDAWIPDDQKSRYGY